MRLCGQKRESNAELKQLGERKFSKIENQNNSSS
jgi:hypothetical protein